MTNLCLTNNGNVHIVPYIARLVKVLEPGTHAAAHSSYDPRGPGTAREEAVGLIGIDK